jgi:hypothetical protein
MFYINLLLEIHHHYQQQQEIRIIHQTVINVNHLSNVKMNSFFNKIFIIVLQRILLSNIDGGTNKPPTQNRQTIQPVMVIYSLIWVFIVETIPHLVTDIPFESGELDFVVPDL